MITARTALPLVIAQRLTEMVVVDPLPRQCEACVDYVLG